MIEHPPAWHARELALLAGAYLPSTGGWKTNPADPATLIGWARIRNNTERAVLTIARVYHENFGSGFIATMYLQFHGGVIHICTDSGRINAVYAVQDVLDRVEKWSPDSTATATVASGGTGGVSGGVSGGASGTSSAGHSQAPATPASCENCRFWRVPVNSRALMTDRGRSGEPECRRHPPVMQHDGNLWPKVNMSDWCGEHEPQRAP